MEGNKHIRHKIFEACPINMIDVHTGTLTYYHWGKLNPRVYVACGHTAYSSLCIIMNHRLLLFEMFLIYNKIVKPHIYKLLDNIHNFMCSDVDLIIICMWRCMCLSLQLEYFSGRDVVPSMVEMCTITAPLPQQYVWPPMVSQGGSELSINTTSSENTWSNMTIQNYSQRQFVKNTINGNVDKCYFKVVSMANNSQLTIGGPSPT